MTAATSHHQPLMKDTTPFSSGEENDPTYGRVAPPVRATKYYALTKSVKSRTEFLGTVSCATTEAKENLTRVAPDGKHCLVTRAEGELQCTHLISRFTDITIRRALKTAWGIKTKRFDLNAVQNILWLRSDMKLAFDAYRWLLLPTEEDLQAAIDFSSGRADQQTPSGFRTVYSNTTWKYHFLSLDYNAFILRYGNVPNSYMIHDPPYTNLSPLESHISPFHIIYNVGEKVHDIKDPEYEGHCKLPEGPIYRPLLDKCEALYLSWVGPALEALKADGKLSPSERSRHQPPSESERQSKNEERTRRLKPEAVSGSHKPTRHWASLDDWVASVKSCASNLGPKSDWEGAEQAKRSLFKYRNEAAREPPRGSWEKWLPEYEFE